VTTFYLDEDISHNIVPFLHMAGHRAITTRDLRREHSSDDQQLFFAWQQQWIFVTHNGRDYSLIHGALHRWAMTLDIDAIHAGILVIPHGLSARMAASILDVFVASEWTIANTLYAWRPMGEWVRRELAPFKEP
jgi:hypothetical protein